MAKLSSDLINLGDVKFIGFNMQFSLLLSTDRFAKLANVCGHSLHKANAAQNE